MAAAGCLAVLIVLMGSGVCSAQAEPIQNAGFEVTVPVSATNKVRPDVPWNYVSHSLFDFYCTDLWQTEGVWAAGMYSRLGRSFSVGDGPVLRQYVDLTGIQSIVFDARLAAYGSLTATTFEHFEASFCVDGDVLWSQRLDGTYLDQQVDVSHLDGYHWIELRETAIENLAYGAAAYWVQWDNFRVVEAPREIEAYAVLDPPVLHVHSCGNWVTCYLELPDGYSVSDIDGATVTLQDIPAYLGAEAWAVAAANEENVRDFDEDGDLERMVKFDRAALIALVQPPQATLVLKGKLANGVDFEASITVDVVDKLAEFKERCERIRKRIQELREQHHGKCRLVGDRIRETREKHEAQRDEVREKLQDLWNKLRQAAQKKAANVSKYQRHSKRG